ncbi:hypothetical protein TcYC6_0020090 [Trypanosoma cruzi]|nr:hypothetical protein TcYC6_0020090 [Trypanosoma cruzi]
MTTNRCIHAAATAPYERYMTTNRSIHAAAAAPYERYMTTNRVSTLRRRTLNMSLSFSGDNANVLDCSKIELNTLRENGSRDHIFFSSVAKQAHNSPGRGSSPKKPKFFSFFFGILVSYCFLNFWFAGRCASSAIALIPSVSWCAAAAAVVAA